MFSFQAFSFSIYHLWPFYVGLPCSFFCCLHLILHVPASVLAFCAAFITFELQFMFLSCAFNCLVPSSRVSCMERLLYPSISTPALFLVLYKMFSCSIDDESFRIFWATCSRLLCATLSICLLHNVLAGLLLLWLGCSQAFIVCDAELRFVLFNFSFSNYFFHLLSFCGFSFRRQTGSAQSKQKNPGKQTQRFMCGLPLLQSTLRTDRISVTY